jgi:hypothetical protein
MLLTIGLLQLFVPKPLGNLSLGALFRQQVMDHPSICGGDSRVCQSVQVEVPGIGQWLARRAIGSPKCGRRPIARLKEARTFGVIHQLTVRIARQPHIPKRRWTGFWN